MNKNFMYGVGAVKYKDFVVGYIEKNSFDMGGQKPESAKIEAEQVPGTPVLIIPQSNGSIAPTFNVIQLNYENLHSLLGGTMHYKEEDSEKKTPIGWTAPTAAVLLTGPWEIALVSGQSILIPNGTLLSNLGGKLTLTETAKSNARWKWPCRKTAPSPMAYSIRILSRKSGNSINCLLLNLPLLLPLTRPRSSVWTKLSSSRSSVRVRTRCWISV